MATAPGATRTLNCAMLASCPENSVSEVRSQLRASLGVCSLFAAMLGLVFCVGCASTEKSHLTLTGDPLVDGPNALTNGPARDRVLWQYRTAVASICAGNFPQAREMLDDAIRSLQA